MKIFNSFRILTYSLIAFILISAMSAIAAANTVPSTRITSQKEVIRINDFKPSACATINLTNLVSGSGILTGTIGNDLILGGSGADIINGLGGNDCIIGGGGDDQVIGEDGNDVCLGDSGTDVFIDCETQIQ